MFSGGAILLLTGPQPHEDAATPARTTLHGRAMTSVFVISRDPRMRNAVTDYLRERWYDTATAQYYDAAMIHFSASQHDAVVTDGRGLPRGDGGSTFVRINHIQGSA